MKKSLLSAQEMIGQVYGRLTVVSLAGEKRRKPLLACRCSCGSEKVTDMYAIRSGAAKSCGCGEIPDMVGEVFGRLTITEVVGTGRYGPIVRCSCACGTTTVTRLNRLKTGKTRSCGCLKLEVCRTVNITHGCARHCTSKVTPEHHTWTELRYRCRSQDSPHYKDYGGRGIKVCERWLNSFENFLADMGPRPSPNHSIDRIDTNGDYDPENCRWATHQEQIWNRRNTIWIEYRGEKKPAGVWAKQLHISVNTIRKRLQEGLTGDALFKKK